MTAGRFPELLNALLRWFALFFHAGFAVALLVLAVVSAFSPPHELWFPVLPWSGTWLIGSLVGLGVAGLLIVAAAARGRARGLWLAWSLAVFVLIARGYFFSDYRFVPDSSQFTTALLVLLASLMAILGAKRSLRPGPRKT
ncbi:MAG: hypothetical protein RMK57_01220 [Bryobacterales bacterium]|nr:hypothetical protein [Bryobacteraceae bacterium]MDW8353123.1 hypothetical protein [Bryobacterales bacterium]